MKIETKFDAGQEVYVIGDDKIYHTQICTIWTDGECIVYYCKNDIDSGERIYLEPSEDLVFATREEAEAKLKENKNESICN